MLKKKIFFVDFFINFLLQLYASTNHVEKLVKKEQALKIIKPFKTLHCFLPLLDYI